jgi:hypothetical protein
MRNLQEQVKNAFFCQKLFWPFTARINCYSDLKYFANSLPSASNLKSFSPSLEQCLHTVSQNNFGNKIPFLMLTFVSFRSLGLNTVTAYQRAKVSALKIVGLRIGSPRRNDIDIQTIRLPSTTQWFRKMKKIWGCQW